MASEPSTDLLVDDATLDLLQAGGAQYRVRSVQMENNNLLPGVLGDEIQAVWQPVRHPGTFVSTVRWSREWDQELAATIAVEFEQVESIYAIAV